MQRKPWKISKSCFIS